MRTAPSDSMVHVVGVVDNVVQVVDRDRRDGEFAAVAAQTAPRPRVGWHVGVGVGHDTCGIEQFGGDRGGVLGRVVIGNRGVVLVPVRKLRVVLGKHQLDPVVEDPVHVADVAAVFQRGPHVRLTALGGLRISKTSQPVAGVAADPIGDLDVVHGCCIEATFGAGPGQHPGPVLGVGLNRLAAHGTSVAATSRIRSPAPEEIGSPWPKQAVSTSRAASRRNDATVCARFWLKTPSMTAPTLATVSPVNSTPWRGRWIATLPSVWPGIATTSAPPPKSSPSPPRSS